MSVIRAWISNLRGVERDVADAEGMAGEEFEVEVHQPYGFSVNREGETIVIGVGDSDENKIALPPGGDRIAAENETLIYHGDTEIRVTPDGIFITTGGNFLNIQGGTLSTDLDISTTGDLSVGGNIVTGGTVTAQGNVTGAGVSLQGHTHGGVQTGNGISGAPT